MNMFLVSRVLNTNLEDQQVMLFDNHADGPYIDLIKQAFSPEHSIIRHTVFNKKIVFFSLNMTIWSDYFVYVL